MKGCRRVYSHASYTSYTRALVHYYCAVTLFVICMGAREYIYGFRMIIRFDLATDADLQRRVDVT